MKIFKWKTEGSGRRQAKKKNENEKNIREFYLA
jgi:hypothetical protein